jgi:hypothetical protein
MRSGASSARRTKSGFWTKWIALPGMAPSAPSCVGSAFSPRRCISGGRNAMPPLTKRSRRNGGRGRSGIRWPAKTRSCAVRINVCRKSWRKRTSSSTFKKKWPGCWATHWPRFQARRSDHDRPRSTSSSGRHEAGLPGVGGSARDLVSAPAAPCFSSCRPEFVSAFGAGAIGGRTGYCAGVPS